MNRVFQTAVSCFQIDSFLLHACDIIIIYSKSGKKLLNVFYIKWFYLVEKNNEFLFVLTTAGTWLSFWQLNWDSTLIDLIKRLNVWGKMYSDHFMPSICTERKEYSFSLVNHNWWAKIGWIREFLFTIFARPQQKQKVFFNYFYVNETEKCQHPSIRRHLWILMRSKFIYK